MKEQIVAIFRPYDFVPGQKIHIENGPRMGDWEVVGMTDRKIKLQCPISLKTFEWNRFCYFVGDLKVAEWPRRDTDA
jgi:hypothetical protein